MPEPAPAIRYPLPPKQIPYDEFLHRFQLQQFLFVRGLTFHVREFFNECDEGLSGGLVKVKAFPIRIENVCPIPLTSENDVLTCKNFPGYDTCDILIDLMAYAHL